MNDTFLDGAEDLDETKIPAHAHNGMSMGRQGDIVSRCPTDDSQAGDIISLWVSTICQDPPWAFALALAFDLPLGAGEVEAAAARSRSRSFRAVLRRLMACRILANSSALTCAP